MRHPPPRMQRAVSCDLRVASFMRGECGNQPPSPSNTCARVPHHLLVQICSSPVPRNAANLYPTIRVIIIEDSRMCSTLTPPASSRGEDLSSSSRMATRHTSRARAAPLRAIHTRPATSVGDIFTYRRYTVSYSRTPRHASHKRAGIISLTQEAEELNGRYTCGDVAA